MSEGRAGQGRARRRCGLQGREEISRVALSNERRWCIARGETNKAAWVQEVYSWSVALGYGGAGQRALTR